MSRRLPRIWPGAFAARLPARRRSAARDDWGTFEREFWVYVGAAPPPEARRAELERLSRLLHEALVICERVDELLPEIRDDDGPCGALPHRAAPLISRLHSMRGELTSFAAPEAAALARDAEALVNFY